jgi:hypothetical protein
MFNLYGSVRFKARKFMLYTAMSVSDHTV